VDAKEVENKSRHIKPEAERMLWAVSAGICEFKGCCNKLYTHHVTKENINQSEKAHIYAFSEGGKRFSRLLHTEKINDIENLIIVCEECHKLIDSEDTDYSAYDLIAMKKEHEERVSRLVSIKPDLQSEVIIYNANIANKAIKISDYCANEAITPGYYPARALPINLSPDLRLYDNEDNYWNVMATDLERQFALFEPRIRDKHISLFAIAPQPLLFKLGSLFNRNFIVDVHQSQGSIDMWHWETDKKTIYLESQILPEVEPSTHVVLTIELTAHLSEKELRNTFGNGYIYRIITPVCDPHVIRSKADLNAVVEQYRNVLNIIRKSHAQNVNVSYVPIAPASVSVEAGRQLMKGDPEITIYDRNYITKEWTKALVVNGKEEEQCITKNS